MAEESRSAPREFQLETRHLAAIVVLIAFLCVASFMLGRWVERQAFRGTGDEAARGAAAGDLAVEDVNRELTYFRTLEGDSPPPSVAVPPPAPRPEPVRVAAGAQADAARASGRGSPQGILIQVLATKDHSAAALLAKRLESRGYPVSVAEGTGPGDAGWSKVRVGPYAARAEAERIARRLRSEEGVRTWIP